MPYCGATRFEGAQVSLEGGKRIVVTWATGRSDRVPELANDLTIRCTAKLCTAFFIGFVVDGDHIQVVDRNGQNPDDAGSGKCKSPAVADAGVVKFSSPTSFRFVSGATGGIGADCWQVVLTYVATKI